jgi:hypothetical protein
MYWIANYRSRRKHREIFAVSPFLSFSTVSVIFCRTDHRSGAALMPPITVTKADGSPAKMGQFRTSLL